MKVLFCQKCGDIVAPGSEDFEVRWCRCHRHAVWWRDGNRGLISVHDENYTIPAAISQPQHPQFAKQYEELLHLPPTVQYAWLLGITNLFLHHHEEQMDGLTIQTIIDSHEDWYLFKKIRSPIVRFRPGASSDSRWERNLPSEQVTR